MWLWGRHLGGYATMVAMAKQKSVPVVSILRRASERLRAGHLWVYESDVVQLVPAEDVDEIAAGALVTVTDNRGITLGTALYSNASQIALRMVSEKPALERKDFLALLRERMDAALQIRTEMLSSDTNACRLIFSEGDNLPGIIADRYNDLIILQLLTQGTAQDDVRKEFVRAVKSAPELESLAVILERPDPRIRELEQLAAPDSAPLFAADLKTPKTATVFMLNGLSFHYDASSGQKTGAFLDQRENYLAAVRHAKPGGDALDVCCYQGGFALHLARVCGRVTGVDASRAALEVADRNFELNREGLTAEVEWMEADAFELLREYEASGRQYDCIVLDPPAFAKSKRAAEGALRGYKEMNLRALKMLRPGGTLVTCSCSHHVSPADFTAVVAAAAGDAGRRVQLVERRGAAPDHPEILTLPETGYLKCLICKAL